MNRISATRHPTSTRIAAAALVLATLSPWTTHAAEVQDRAAMAATDLVIWTGPLGYGNAPSAFVTTSAGGMDVAVSSPGGTWQTQQSGCGGSFPSNFLPCEQALFTSAFTLTPNPIVLDFATPVNGGGAQFAQGITYGEFTAQIAAFDADGQLLEIYTRAGNTTGAADGSAIFLGVLRDQADIAQLQFSVPFIQGWSGYTYFGINQVSLSVVPPPVPEPGSAALLGVGLGVLPLVLWARRRHAK